jgi:hypothetical protein
MTTRDLVIYRIMCAGIYAALVVAVLVVVAVVAAGAILVAWLTTFDTGRVILFAGAALVALCATRSM